MSTSVSTHSSSQTRRLAPPTGVDDRGSPLGHNQPGDTSMMRAERRRDLAYASALIEGADRIRRQPDLVSVLAAVATEALTLIRADETCVTRLAGLRRTLVDVHTASHVDDHHRRLLWAAGQNPRLMSPGTTGDLTRERWWNSRGSELASAPWRAVMTVALVSPNPQNQIRLSWFSAVPYAFADQADIVELFARMANQAVCAATEREDPARTSRIQAPTFAPPQNRPTGLSGELLDAITDAVFARPTPRARSEAIRCLLEEVYGSLAWLKTNVDDDELRSLRRVVAMAVAHAQTVGGQRPR